MLASALALTACVSTPEGFAPAASAPQPVFDPFIFFAGETRGTGTLSKVLAGDTPVRVEGSGRIEAETIREASWAAPPRRVLVIDQVVHEGDKPASKRQWRLHAAAPGVYEGTLSGASTPVTARTEGNQLVITFSLKDGSPVRQVLTLAPDGQSAANVLTVTMLGVTVAVLAEDIVKR